MKNYDSIVVGAGNGGLTGALTLCKAGKKVLLIEKHNVPGGCGTSFRRGEFEFEAALHQLYEVSDNINGEKGLLHKLFEELGVWDKIEFVLQKEAFTIFVAGMGQIAMPGSHDGFVDALIEISPEEADTIKEYQKLCDKIADEFYMIYENIAKDEPMTKEEYPLVFEYGNTTAKEMLDKTFTNPIVKGVYQTYYAYIGMPIERIPFTVLASLYARGNGTCHIKGGSQAMSSAIADEFIACGGKIMYNTSVEKILIENNSAKGVQTAAGEIFTADTVLCNADKVNVYVNMIEEKYVPEEVFEDLRVSTPSQSIVGAFLGLDCTPKEAGIRNGTNFLLESPTALPMRHDVKMNQNDRVSGVLMSCYNIDEPSFSPEGTCVISLIASSTTDAWSTIPPRDYNEAKMEYASKLLDYLDQYYPKVRQHISEIEAFTPLTLVRYIGTTKGAIYGLDGHFKDLIANKLEARSPIEGLYFCGASIVFGGFNTTLLSGNAVARLMLKDLEKVGN